MYRPLALLLCAVAVLGAAWALFVPPGQAPDEPAHIGYAQVLAEDFRLPDEKSGRTFSREQDLAQAYANVDQTAQVLLTKPEWSGLAYDEWQQADARLPRGARGEGGHADDFRGPNPGPRQSAALLPLGGDPLPAGVGRGLLRPALRDAALVRSAPASGDGGHLVADRRTGARAAHAATGGRGSGRTPADGDVRFGVGQPRRRADRVFRARLLAGSAGPPARLDPARWRGPRCGHGAGGAHEGHRATRWSRLPVWRWRSALGGCDS